MKTSQISLLVLVLLLSTGLFAAGCRDTPPTGKPAATDDHGHAHEGHSHGAAPHDGTLADWGGGKFHVEFTVDHDQQQATVYVLGADAKTPAPIQAAELQLSISDPQMHLSLSAAPQPGDPAGTSSRFVGRHEGFGVVQEYEGTVTGLVDGTPYSGNFREEPHDHSH